MKRFLFDEDFNIIADGKTICAIEDCIAKFNASEGEKEKATEYVFRDKSNNKLEVVLAKVVILNEFYSTHLNRNVSRKEKDHRRKPHVDLFNMVKRIVSHQLFDHVSRNGKGKKEKHQVDVLNMAKHIVSCQFFDQYWSSADEEEQLKAVRYINAGESRFKNNRNHYAAYSFATKYCSWHDPEKFPIVDRYSKGMIYYLNLELRFYDNKYQRFLTKAMLNDYGTFCKAYRALQDYLRERNKEISTRDLDKFLWYYGKEHAIKLGI